MKYKNIIFDFGNVIVEFNENQVIGNFCSNPEDYSLMKKAVFHDWDKLDGGQISYAEYMEHAAMLLPKRLYPNLTQLAKEWYRHLAPLPEIWNLIYELKENGYAIYILSNASTFFAKHAGFYEITKEFDGIVFSAPIKMLKPEQEIYQYLFDTYKLVPEECLFLDDKPENIHAARQVGMDGIIFRGDVTPIRKILEL